MNDTERFLNLSLEMERHSRGLMFEDAMRTFPSAKFHEWCDLAKKLEGQIGLSCSEGENK